MKFSIELKPEDNALGGKVLENLGFRSSIKDNTYVIHYMATQRDWFLSPDAMADSSHDPEFFLSPVIEALGEVGIKPRRIHTNKTQPGAVGLMDAAVDTALAALAQATALLSTGSTGKKPSKVKAASDQWRTLNDAAMLQPVLAAGRGIDIFYVKDAYARDLSMGVDFLLKQGALPSTDDVIGERTHVKLGSVGRAKLNELYAALQGESWSPSGEAKSLLRRLGLRHTSMMVGDCVAIGDRVLMVDRNGFFDLGGQKKVSGTAVKAALGPQVAFIAAAKSAIKAARGAISAAEDVNQYLKEHGRCPPGWHQDADGNVCMDSEEKQPAKKAPPAATKSAPNATSVRRLKQSLTSGPSDVRSKGIDHLVEKEPDLAKALLTLDKLLSSTDTAKALKYAETVVKKNKGVFINDAGNRFKWADLSTAIDEAKENPKATAKALENVQKMIIQHGENRYHDSKREN